MRNQDQWKPTKFILNPAGKLKANESGVKSGSQFITNLTAEMLENKINAYARGHLLDLGCGFAPLYLLYRNKVSQVTCMDWENSLHKNPLLDIVHDITQPLPLTASSIDTILMSDVLEHIPNPEEVFKELSRVLKPTGYLILNVPFAYGEHEAPHDYYRYTQYALNRFATANGFDDISVEPVGDALGVLCDILSKAFMDKPLIKVIPILLAKYLHKNYRKKKFHMRHMPLGYVLTCRKKV